MASWASLVTLALRWSPQVAEAVRGAVKYARSHPDQAERVRQHLEKLLSRAGETRRSGTGAKIRAMVESVRAAADDFDASDIADDQVRLQTEDWRRRADSIERALRVAEARPGADGKRMVKQVFSRAQSLIAEVSTVVIEPAADDFDERAPSVGTTRWSLEDLQDELARWEAELKGQGKSPNTVDTYVGRSRTFLRWLAGEYNPRR